MWRRAEEEVVMVVMMIVEVIVVEVEVVEKVVVVEVVEEEGSFSGVDLSGSHRRRRGLSMNSGKEKHGGETSGSV